MFAGLGGGVGEKGEGATMFEEGRSGGKGGVGIGGGTCHSVLNSMVR